MRRLLASLVVAAAVTARAAPAAAAPEAAEAQLGAYEKQALDTALERRHLVLDPAPAGKRVGAIHVVNLPVFSERNGPLRFFNVFHRTTREHVIEREVLLRPGDTWDPDIVEETRRKLSDSLYTTLVVIVPVKSEQPGTVDVLVVTRDIWSLRLNTNYEIQQSTLSQLSFALSENNLLGYRKTVAFSFVMDLGSYFVGPIYIDKNILGTRLRLSSQVGALFARADSAFEGTRSSTTLSYPLWSLRSKWGASLAVSHFDGKSRLFQGIDLATYDNPDTATVEEVPYIYDLRLFNTTESVVRQFPIGDVIQRVTAGHRLALVRPSVTGDFAFDDATRAAFERDVLPRSERSSSLFLQYSLFLNSFEVFRNIDTYSLPEDVRLGPSIGAEVASALKVIGSEQDFYTGQLSASYTGEIPTGGLYRVSAGASTRLQDGELIDNVVSGTVTAASPALGSAVRLVGEIAAAAHINETNNKFFVLGGSNGLRGYAINEFTGLDRVRGNFEVRTLPIKVLFTRVGGVVFYDVGHAADSLDQLRLQQDVGIGLRTLTPQLQPFVFRFDYAVPLNGANAGFPGRFIAGIRQAF